MTTNRSSTLVAPAAGCLVLAGFVLAMTQDSAAQATKKTDPKSKTKDKDKSKSDDPDAPKKEAKVEPPPANFRAERRPCRRGGNAGQFHRRADFEVLEEEQHLSVRPLHRLRVHSPGLARYHWPYPDG